MKLIYINISVLFLCLVVLTKYTLDLSVKLSNADAKIEQIKKTYVKYDTARERAEFVNVSIEELGFLCTDAISIANSAYDIASGNITNLDYTTDELDSLIKHSTNTAYDIKRGYIKDSQL